MNLKFNFHRNILFIALAIISSCAKAPDQPSGTGNKVIISVNDISNITWTTATSGGVIGGDSGREIISRGVCWNSDPYGIGLPTIKDNKTVDGSSIGSFTSNLTGLIPGADYWVRAYAIDKQDTIYSEQKKFRAQNAILPTVSTADISNITANTATTGGNVSSDGGSAVTSKGIYYGTTTKPGNSSVFNGPGSGSFISNFQNLTPSTTYYFRAYAVNSLGTAFGEEKQFTTSDAVPPTVNTSGISNITRSSALLSGEALSTGGRPILEFGFCWSTSINPTILNSKSGGLPTGHGDNIGPFSSNISSFSPNTMYYVRAYATSQAGTGYGAQMQFTTLP